MPPPPSSSSSFLELPDAASEAVPDADVECVISPSVFPVSTSRPPRRRPFVVSLLSRRHTSAGQDPLPPSRRTSANLMDAPTAAPMESVARTTSPSVTSRSSPLNPTSHTSVAPPSAHSNATASLPQLATRSTSSSLFPRAEEVTHATDPQPPTEDAVDDYNVRSGSMSTADHAPSRSARWPLPSQQQLQQNESLSSSSIPSPGATEIAPLSRSPPQPSTSSSTPHFFGRPSSRHYDLEEDYLPAGAAAAASTIRLSSSWNEPIRLPRAATGASVVTTTTASSLDRTTPTPIFLGTPATSARNSENENDDRVDETHHPNRAYSSRENSTTVAATTSTFRHNTNPSRHRQQVPQSPQQLPHRSEYMRTSLTSEPHRPGPDTVLQPNTTRESRINTFATGDEGFYGDDIQPSSASTESASPLPDLPVDAVSAAVLTSEQIESMRENARTLRTLSLAATAQTHDVDLTVLQTLYQFCQQDQVLIQATLRQKVAQAEVVSQTIPEDGDSENWNSSMYHQENTLENSHSSVMSPGAHSTGMLPEDTIDQLFMLNDFLQHAMALGRETMDSLVEQQNDRETHKQEHPEHHFHPNYTSLINQNDECDLLAFNHEPSQASVASLVPRIPVNAVASEEVAGALSESFREQLPEFSLVHNVTSDSYFRDINALNGENIGDDEGGVTGFMDVSEASSQNSLLRHHDDALIIVNNEHGRKHSLSLKNTGIVGGAMEVSDLVAKKDIFSLICLLRAPTPVKRLEAAWALMVLAKNDGVAVTGCETSGGSMDSIIIDMGCQKSADDVSGRYTDASTSTSRDSTRSRRHVRTVVTHVASFSPLRNEIRSSGGIQSLLTLFRAPKTQYNLKVIAALAIAYVIPSWGELSSVGAPSTRQALKIAQCLRFLTSAQPVNFGNGIVVTSEEAWTAATVALTTFWMNMLDPMLRSTGAVHDHGETTSSQSSRSQWPKRNDYRREGSIETQELIEMTVSLIIHIARGSDNATKPAINGDISMWQYALIEHVCAVEVARPIAVREGVLLIIVGWIRSHDQEKIRPAVSALRYLSSVTDRYLSGWIHSQIVNDGALKGILSLTNDYSTSQDVKVSIAQILSSLCASPHTRAAVAEAKCVNYLVGFLYELSDSGSKEAALFSGGALLHLASGAISRSSILGFDDVGAESFVPPDKRDSLVDDIVNSGAVRSFVIIAMEHHGKLRSVAVEAIRTFSEDVSPRIKSTRLRLCEDGACMALGVTLNEDVSTIIDTSAITSVPIELLQEVIDALCALANILDPVQDIGRSNSLRRLPSSEYLSSRPSLLRGCFQFVESGGIKSLLRVASLPFGGTSDFNTQGRLELLEEACRSLAALAPLILDESNAAKGCAVWANDVFGVFHGLLKRLLAVPERKGWNEENMELQANVLRGLTALATSEPLKMRIIERTLPLLLTVRNGESSKELANTASQAIQSLGFAESDYAVQLAGKNSSLLVDWFCLRRYLLLQAMVRNEIREIIQRTWTGPMRTTNISSDPTELARGTSGSSTASGLDLFENFSEDRESKKVRSDLIRQYTEVYGMNPSKSDTHDLIQRSRSWAEDQDTTNDGLLQRQVFPLCDCSTEANWVLQHTRSLSFLQQPANLGDECGPWQRIIAHSGPLSPSSHSFLELCFPSELLRDCIFPIHDLSLGASFNFRALIMPQRRYFSFRREGQLLLRLCDEEDEVVGGADTHWTLGFMNSTFSGEFVDNLNHALYLCPMIRGLSFSRNTDWDKIFWLDRQHDGTEGVALLANLIGSRPPWISYVTLDGVLEDRDLSTLVSILKNSARLGRDSDPESADKASLSIPSSDHPSQGTFTFLGIRNSSCVSAGTWESFIQLLGRPSSSTQNLSVRPLTSLKKLDLSGNNLGDEVSASLLALIHDKDSCCSLEQLDLSDNCIAAGTNTLKALRGYVEFYRINVTASVKRSKNKWKSPLHTLRLARNGLCQGNAWLGIILLLEHNALTLKMLDLSGNGLDLKDDEHEFCDMLVSPIIKNTCLVHLNLSQNMFSSGTIDRMLSRLTEQNEGAGLAFLRLENNTPPLSDDQIKTLWLFSFNARANALQRDYNEKERMKVQGIVHLETAATISAPGSSGSVNDISTVETSLPSIFPSCDNMITVLFSAPLVYHDTQRRLRAFAKLDFDMERELIWQCLKEASRDIELNFDTATHDRLLATITKRCRCLHYSGHGHPKYLPFEDGAGGPNWLKVGDIENLIARKGGAPFRFVFVSACYSGLAGETFASAGVPHVVCCQQESEIKDSAALAFTRQFYLALAVGHTVRQSFDFGCKAVRATPDLRDADVEMRKFMLLPRDGNHDVPIFTAKPVLEWPRQVIDPRGLRSSIRGSRFKRTSGRMGLKGSKIHVGVGGAKRSELSVRNMIQEDASPAPPQFFIGREVEMYLVLKQVLAKRLVSVVGDVGSGRSSLVCALCQYINERASTILAIEGIYYMRVRQRRDPCRTLIQELLQKLIDADKSIPPDGMIETADLETLFQLVCVSLRNEKILIVVDHVELLEDSDEASEFRMLLSILFRETRDVKLLVTARTPLGTASLGGQVEYPFALGPLNYGDTVRLFANLCPRFHTAADRQDIFLKLVNDGRQAEMRPGDPDLGARAGRIMKALGGGIPFRIEQAAYDCMDNFSRVLDLADEADMDSCASSWKVGTDVPNTEEICADTPSG